MKSFFMVSKVVKVWFSGSKRQKKVIFLHKTRLFVHRKVLFLAKYLRN